MPRVGSGGNQENGRVGQWSRKGGDECYALACRLYVCGYESTIMLYKGAKGKAQVQVIFDTDTFWLSQQRMAELFGVTQQDISYHLQQINDIGLIW